MITQENQTGKKPGEDLSFNLAILKVKQIHYERIEVYTITTQTTNILWPSRVENILP